MYHSPGIHFENILVNMDEANEFTNRNQKVKRIKSNKHGASVYPSITYVLSKGIVLWNFLIGRIENWPWI